MNIICGLYSRLLFSSSIVFLSAPLHAAPLHLDFSYEVDGKRYFRDSLRYKNESGETFSITRIDWLATDFSLVNTKGETIRFPKARFAFIPSTGTTTTLPNIPPGKYQSLTFHLGPDKEVNHSDPALYTANHPLNPNLNKLHWDWADGYIFLALEGHWRAQDEKLPNGFAYHYARDPNRIPITLPLDLDLRHESRVSIILDPAKILSGLSFAKDGATTHSHEDDPVSARMKENLSSAFRIGGILRGGLPTPPNRPSPIDIPTKFTPYPLTFPQHVPLPALPPDNPLIQERVTLGEILFHDPRLSRTNTISCSSCHQDNHVLSDPRQFSLGVDGKHPKRHSMPLFNLAWKDRFFWDGRALSLRAQTLMPIEDPLEMDEDLDNVIHKLKGDPDYPKLFATAFQSGAITSTNISLALENFLLTRLSFDSKFDLARKGQATFTEQEQRGLELFFTENEPRLGRKGADCFHCHGGAHFTDHHFHNNGLKTTEDLGLAAVTNKDNDRYKFATPSLRNVALTAPYMHDGRFATLEEVIDHYNSDFIRNETLDPNLAKHPKGLGLTEEDKAALIAFLKSLSNPELLK